MSSNNNNLLLLECAAKLLFPPPPTTAHTTTTQQSTNSTTSILPISPSLLPPLLSQEDNAFNQQCQQLTILSSTSVCSLWAGFGKIVRHEIAIVSSPHASSSPSPKQKSKSSSTNKKKTSKASQSEIQQSISLIVKDVKPPPFKGSLQDNTSEDAVSHNRKIKSYMSEISFYQGIQHFGILRPDHRGFNAKIIIGNDDNGNGFTVPRPLHLSMATPTNSSSPTEFKLIMTDLSVEYPDVVHNDLNFEESLVYCGLGLGVVDLAYFMISSVDGEGVLRKEMGYGDEGERVVGWKVLLREYLKALKSDGTGGEDGGDGVMGYEFGLLLEHFDLAVIDFV
ncbi:hypothetical protein HDU76_009661, partial [Blyttiomyces sp. JEL0837]